MTLFLKWSVTETREQYGFHTDLTQEAVSSSEEDPSNQLLGSSITYRIAVGPQKGRKVMTLQTLVDCGDDPFTTRVGNVAGFSLHAGVATRVNERATKRGAFRRAGTLVPVNNETGDFRETSFNHTQRSDTL